MKAFSLLAFLLLGGLCSLSSWSQGNFTYTYDNAGNRTKRGPSTTKLKSAYIVNFSSEASGDSSQVPKVKESEIKMAALEINIYPNPTHGEITLQLKNLDSTKPCVLSIVNLSGQEIISRRNLSDYNEIDLSPYSDGLYIVKLQVGETVRKWKIVKK
jgi:hypothetical protein